MGVDGEVTLPNEAGGGGLDSGSGKHTSAQLYRQILDSAAQTYLNREHQRSYSLNVFFMNAGELVDAMERMKDPRHGFAMMVAANREAGLQAHRELNRHLHNFVSSALSLVDHTRTSMRRHYDGSPLLAAYEAQAKLTFGTSPIAQFVQGLRNYMLHRGLPNSQMFLDFKSDPEKSDGSGTTQTGFRFSVASLLEWNDWKALARAFLKQGGEYIDLQETIEQYVSMVDGFDRWLRGALQAHHATDLQALEKLQREMWSTDARQRTGASDGVVDRRERAAGGSTNFPSDVAVEIAARASELRLRIREVRIRGERPGFPSTRPMLTISADDLIGPAVHWGQEADGTPVVAFATHDGADYGLAGDSFQLLEQLLDSAMKATWIRKKLSRPYIKEAFFDWAGQQPSPSGQDFVEALDRSVQKDVAAMDVWAPIANMEVESGFDFGPVRIEPVTEVLMSELRARAEPSRGTQKESVDTLLVQIANDIQGSAAVRVALEGEPRFVNDHALELARDAVGLLRFLSPGAQRPDMFNAVALMGAEHVPRSRLLMLPAQGMRYLQELSVKRISHWRLSAAQLERLQRDVLDPLGSLVAVDGLSEFAQAVRAGILAYSSSTTFVERLDRLRGGAFALESILLRHEMESRAPSIGRRMALLVSDPEIDREEVQRVVQQVYWLLSQPRLVPASGREDELVSSFMSHAYQALRVALLNVGAFESKAEFLLAVEEEAEAPGQVDQTT